MTNSSDIHTIMRSKTQFVVAPVLVIAAIGTFLITTSTSDSGRQHPPPTVENHNRAESVMTPIDMHSDAILPPDTDAYAGANSDRPSQLIVPEPIDIQKFREVRGYYASGSSDINEMHPYELYDLKTLEQLADNDDGLAQLVFADRISVEEPDRADNLYMDAAVNGKTAALVNIAASGLLVVPGGADWGFPLKTNTGEISEEYIGVLKYYVAAENMGDIVASEMLRTHIDAMNLESTTTSLERVCEAGLGLADQIRAKQRAKWGASRHVETPITSHETTEAVCSD